MPRAAVLGSPIAHSLSPRLHQAAYRVLGLTWEYSAIECDEVGFPAFFSELGEEWMGLSLTMPLKEVVFEVVDDVDDLAAAVGSANTVFRLDAISGNPWRATNTDILGMVRALGDTGVHSLSSATILGAGATARSALAACATLGASSVAVHARRAEAREEMIGLGGRLGVDVRGFDLDPVSVTTDLLVSTLPADIGAPWASVPVSEATALLDVSYHPWPTPLAQRWQEERPDAGLASGRDMLIWQAVAQVGWMTGAFDPRLQEADPLPLEIVQAMRAALDD